MRASVKALFWQLIDYAGLFPPAGLGLSEVARNYERYRTSAESWILNRLILPEALRRDVTIGPGWRVSLLVDQGEPEGPLPPEIETFESKSSGEYSRPVYLEGPASRAGGAFLKLRTGGVLPENIPPSEQVADFLCQAAANRQPFKATAGLHHAIRAVRPLTYAADSPRAMMHGFLNLFAAAAFVWHGAGRATALAILNETDPHAFLFSDGALTWNGRSLSIAQIQSARRDFAHSFGSCSFQEPIADLRELGLLS